MMYEAVLDPRVISAVSAILATLVYLLARLMERRRQRQRLRAILERKV